MLKFSSCNAESEFEKWSLTLQKHFYGRFQTNRGIFIPEEERP